MMLLVLAAVNLTAMAADPMPLHGINGQWGYQNVNGVMVIKAKYDEARQFHEGKAAVHRDGKWGFINPQGRVVVKFLYQACRDYQNGYAVVQRDGKWGAVNAKGEEEVPCKFDSPDDLMDINVLTTDDARYYFKPEK